MTAGLSQVTAAEKISDLMASEMATLSGTPSPSRASGVGAIIIGNQPPGGSVPPREGEPEEDPDALISDPGFRLQCKCVILTYQAKIDEIDIESYLRNDKTKAITWCHEEGSRVHTHVCYEHSKKMDRSLKSFYINGVKCDARVCRATGSAYIPHRDRMHFYVICIFKNTHIASGSCYQPNKDYVVKLQWIKTLWQKGKVDRPIECAVYYLCITEPFRRDVALQMALSQSSKRKEHHERRERLLKKARTPYKKFAEIELWKSQYEFFGSELPLERYKFLYVHGASRLGKSKLVKSYFKNPFVCSQTVSWHKYSPDEHDGIIFNDISLLDRYIYDHHDLLQCAEIQTINNSATGCYEKQLDIVDKPLIFTGEHALVPCPWVDVNCITCEITELTYE